MQPHYWFRVLVCIMCLSTSMACDESDFAPDSSAPAPDAASEDDATGEPDASLCDATAHDAQRCNTTEAVDASMLDGSDLHTDDAGDAARVSDGGEDTDAGDARDAAPSVEAGDLDSERCSMDAGRTTSASLLVTASGGELELCTRSGGLLRLTFPPSAAGQLVSAAVVDPSEVTWSNPSIALAIRDAVRLEPATLTFGEPVQVRLPFATLSAFVFSDRTGVPLPLRIPAGGGLLELRSFGTLGVLGPSSCIVGDAVSNAWRDTPASGMCSAYTQHGRSTYRESACHNAAFCADLSFGCCVPQGAPGVECTNADPLWLADYVRENSVPAYPYCDGPGDTAHVDRCDQLLVANYLDQEVTLRGTNFAQRGYAIGSLTSYGSSSYVAGSRWISPTEVRATVRGVALTSVGTFYLGWQNPPPGALTPSWDWRSNGLPVAIVAPAVTCPVPTEGSPPAGACSRSANGCACSVTFDPGSGPHTYSLTCTGSDCACTRDGAALATLNSSNGGSYVCGNDTSSIVQTWKRLCRTTPGFCP
jgi:hypothetical protein